MTPPVIQTRALTKRFETTVGRTGILGRRTRRTVAALTDLDLVVERGERIAYIGPNGAGKSTSIRILTGTMIPSAGTADVLGHVPWQDRRALAYRIGTVFGQRSQLIEDLPARATFDVHARIYGLAPDVYARQRDTLLDLFEARDVADQPVRSLSLGQRMRCELVASLLHGPDIVFLDEPTIGLDLIAKRTLRDLLLRINEEQGTTMLLTSHDVADLESVAERVVIIDHGRRIFDGSVEQLRRDFLRSKLVEVDFADSREPPASIPGCELLASGPRHLSVRIDLTERRLGDVLDQLVSHRQVDDMTITDPPLEDVIGHIYLGGERA